MVPTTDQGEGGLHSVPDCADPYAELRVRLEKAAWKIVPAWLEDHRDDIVQMALLKCMKAVEEERELNMSFLLKVTHSVVVDEIRRHKRRKETAIEPDSPEPVEPSVRTDPEAVAGGAEIGVEIIGCIAQLAPASKRAVTLYLQGHTVPETAKMLDFSTKKAENLVYRGLASVRECLRSKGLEPD